jgi:TonB family protein
MTNLILELYKNKQWQKTWRLSPADDFLTLGKSAKCKISIPDSNINGVEGLFEYDGKKWCYRNLSEFNSALNLLTLKSGDEVKITSSKEDLVFKVSIPEKKETLFTNYQNFQTAEYTDPHQLYLVYQNNLLIETKLISVLETFIASNDSTKTLFKPVKSSDWKRTNIDPILVLEKTVYCKKENHLRSDKLFKNLLSTENRLSLTITGVLMLILSSLFLVTPKQAQQLTFEKDQPVIYRDVELKTKPKEKKQPSPAPSQVQAQLEKNVRPPSSSIENGASQGSSSIKNLGSGRISQLIGKISASANKSNNLVVSSGISAADANQKTGRALAAIGNINKPGADWVSQGNKSGISVSTSGKAGGKDSSALGGLAAGKAGSGGIGLIEEESEISGGLDREIIAQYIRSQLGQILYCYERQLSANPELYGKVAVKFTILADGGVEAQSITNSTLKHQLVESCILQKVSLWKFPKPEGGTKVLVSYPFLFKSNQ